MSQPALTVRLLGLAAATILAPLALGGCAHQAPQLASFGELGEPMPELATPAPTHHNPLMRVAHWVVPAREPSMRRLGVNSPIVAICSTTGGRAVIDEDLPGLTARPEYDFFKHMSLRTLAAMSGGKLTSEDLAKVDADLAKLDPPEMSLH